MATERDDRLVVGTTDGTLELLEVKPAGGKTMNADDFLHGYKLPELAR